ncbi:hypothetical protein L6R52_29310, partial [Myxococcota bacterium]|nr:hypothetical protein [Myxococcota bacterium]
MAAPTGVWALALGVSLVIGAAPSPARAEAGAEPREIHLDAGPLTEELGRLVLAELPDHVLVSRADPQALEVRVRRVDARLDVEISRRESRVRRRV